MTTTSNSVPHPLPAWLGSLRKTRLGGGERLIKILDGALAGQLAIVCPSDPDDDGNVQDLVYTQADWEAECQASLAFDDDGDLRPLSAAGNCYGQPVAFADAQTVRS